MAYIATDSNTLVVYAGPSAAFVTAWINDQGTPADYTSVDTGDVDLPVLFAVGQWWWDGTAFSAEAPALTGVALRQDAARQQIARLDNLELLIENVRHIYDFGIRNPYRFGIEAINQARHGAYGVWIGDFPNATKLGWVMSSANGPADAPTATEEDMENFISISANIIRQWTTEQYDARLPQQPIVAASTVSPFARINLEDLQTTSKPLYDSVTAGSIFAKVDTAEKFRQLEDNSWVDSIV